MLETETYHVVASGSEVMAEAVIEPEIPALDKEPEECQGEWTPPPAQPLVRVQASWEQARLLEKASVGRRLAAGLIDRLVPMPFLIPFFWPWALVVIAYDLGRDAPGASIGKRLLGLRTVMVSPEPALDGQPCTLGRSLLRNLLWAGSRLCYLSVVLVPVGLALDLAGFLMVAFTPEGRHLGDRMGGTQVVAAASGQGGVV
jgi:uncharacterized RDD family membrane protein YckC